MKRRDFFKNLFGAAIVAAIPMPVMRAIEQASPMPEQLAEIKPITSHLDGWLFVYNDKNEVLIQSQTAHLTMRRDLIEVTQRYDRKGRMKPWREFITGKSSWDIQADNAFFLRHSSPFDLLMKEKTLHAVYADQNHRLVGDVVIKEVFRDMAFKEVSGTASLHDVSSCAVSFVGVGALVYEPL